MSPKRGISLMSTHDLYNLKNYESIQRIKLSIYANFCFVREKKVKKEVLNLSSKQAATGRAIVQQK